MSDFNRECPACGTPIDRALELPGALLVCSYPRCRFSLRFGPSGWSIEGAGIPDEIGRALAARAVHMLAYAEATLDLVLSAPLEALERAEPETARALLAFVDGTLATMAKNSADVGKLRAARKVLRAKVAGVTCANTTE